MTVETLEICPAAEPQATLIMLHGLGADGTDFIPLCDALDLASVGPVRFVLPRAPQRPITINNGHRMRAWYDALGEVPRREDEAGVRDSVRQIHALLDRERARGMPANRIVLAGFSQGCAITLAAGLRYPERLAGLAGLSGYLPLADSTAAERHASGLCLPVFLAHGRSDAMVAMARGTAARDSLTALGYGVEWQDYPMEHSVCIEEVGALNHWLQRVWAR